MSDDVRTSGPRLWPPDPDDSNGVLDRPETVRKCGMTIPARTQTRRHGNARDAMSKRRIDGSPSWPSPRSHLATSRPTTYTSIVPKPRSSKPPLRFSHPAPTASLYSRSRPSRPSDPCPRPPHLPHLHTRVSPHTYVHVPGSKEKKTTTHP